MARWLKRSMSGWKPCPLTYRATDEELARMATDYVRWLAKARGMDTDAAHSYAMSQARGEIVSATTEASGVLQSTEFGSGVRVRKIVTYDKGEHYTPYSGSFYPSPEAAGAGWQRFGGLSWRSNYLPRSDAPTVYEVQLHGRRVDGFLTAGRANALAKKLAEQELKRAVSQPPRLAA